MHAKEEMYTWLIFLKSTIKYMDWFYCCVAEAMLRDISKVWDSQPCISADLIFRLHEWYMAQYSSVHTQ
jgi:hypothetical protein